MSHMCTKAFVDLNFNKMVNDKSINFSQYCPKFDIIIKTALIFTIFREKTQSNPTAL